MRTVQPSVAKRNAFAVWARRARLGRSSTVTWRLPDDVEPPAELMEGAQVDGKPYGPSATSRRRATSRGRLTEPSPPRPGTDDEPEFPEPESDTDGFVVSDHSVEEVLAWVDGDPERGRWALDLERSALKPRVTLISELEQLPEPEPEPETTPATSTYGGLSDVIEEDD